MEHFITSGRIADLVLVILVIEAAILLVWTRGQGFADKLPILANVSAGAGLVLALRASLVGDAWPWIAAGLLLSMIGHAIDLWARLRGR